MDKCKTNAWSTTNEVATVVAGKFTYAKPKHITIQKALFLFIVIHVDYKTHEPTAIYSYANFPFLITTLIVAILSSR